MIGDDCPVFIIAEAGVNHNGDVSLARKLVDAAALAGVDAVKFQTYKSEDLVSEGTEKAEYQKSLGDSETQFDMLKKYELGYSEFRDLDEYCKRRGITFLSTPHTLDAVEILDPIVPAFKLGSGDLTNIPLIKQVAKKNKPMIISTGMSTLDEVVETFNSCIDEGNQELVFLHCTSSYPCKYEEVNLGAMRTMMQKFGDKAIIGYSDHTRICCTNCSCCFRSKGN